MMGSSNACDILTITQASTENLRLSYADMASNPNGMWKERFVNS